MPKDNGFQIILMKQLRLSKCDVEYVYEDCLSEEWFASFEDFMASSDSLILVVKYDEGDAIIKLNELVGSTDPQKSDISKIRSMGESIRRDLIHSTKNEKTFWRELPYFFRQEKVKGFSLITRAFFSSKYSSIFAEVILF